MEVSYTVTVKPEFSSDFTIYVNGERVHKNTNFKSGTLADGTTYCMAGDFDATEIRVTSDRVNIRIEDKR